jgi:hypothetical protein
MRARTSPASGDTSEWRSQVSPRSDAVRPDVTTLSAKDHEDLEFVIRRYHPDGELDLNADLGPYFNRLVVSPSVAALASRFGRFVRTAGDREGTYSHIEREFVDQVLLADWKTNVVALRHIPDAISVGVRVEAIKALRSGNEHELTEGEQLLASFVRGVVDGSVSDELWQVMEQRMGTRGLVEYAAFILWLQWTIRMEQFLGMPNPPDEEIDKIISEYESGERGLPDWRAFIR